MENKMAKLEELNAQLQEKLLTAIPSTIKSEKSRENKGVLKVLSKRLATKLSDDGVSIFFFEINFQILNSFIVTTQFMYQNE